MCSVSHLCNILSRIGLGDVDLSANSLERSKKRTPLFLDPLIREINYWDVLQTTGAPLVQINNQSLTVIATPPASIPADLVDILPEEKGEMRLTSVKPNSSK